MRHTELWLITLLIIHSTRGFRAIGVIYAPRYEPSIQLPAPAVPGPLSGRRGRYNTYTPAGGFVRSQNTQLCEPARHETCSGPATGALPVRFPGGIRPLMSRLVVYHPCSVPVPVPVPVAVPGSGGGRPSSFTAVARPPTVRLPATGLRKPVHLTDDFPGPNPFLPSFRSAERDIYSVQHGVAGGGKAAALAHWRGCGRDR